MFSKIIFTLAMVCVVNASVLSASDDDPEIEVASIPKRCDFRACYQLCRRLKFPGGACVNGRCKCDNFLNALDDAVENTLSDLENSVLQQDDTETGVTASLNRCKVKTCDWVCRRLHKTSGSCVDGRCKCDKSHNAGEQPSDIEDLVSLADAMNDLDESVSLHEKFFSDKFQNTEENAVDEYSELDTKRVCTLPKCKHTCTRRGYEGATCVKGRCKCYNFSIISIPASELSEDPTERGCSMQTCDKLCRRLKFPGGACFNGRCKCYNFFTAEEERTASAFSACNTVNCNQMCHRLKYAGGWCRFGQCQCY